MSLPRNILITGCSSGIGLYCAKQLSQEGYRVIASCQDDEDTQHLILEGIECITLDLNDEQSIERGWQQVIDKTHGQLYALFNNGAYGQTGAIEDLPTTALRQQFQTNLFGLHHLIRLAIPLMLNQADARIIQNSSVLGLVAMKYRGAYCASKFALEGYTDALRLELEDTPIQVSLIEPGPITSQFRHNARRHFLQNIDWTNSRHRKAYQQTLSRLEKTTATNRFTLGPEAVCKPLLHALASKQARSRYYVTTPTRLMGIARRLFPTNILDKILKAGGN